jgi:hypothetical protein
MQFSLKFGEISFSRDSLLRIQMDKIMRPWFEAVRLLAGLAYAGQGERAAAAEGCEIDAVYLANIGLFHAFYCSKAITCTHSLSHTRS